MTVSVRFAATSMGEPLALVQNQGTYSPGAVSTVSDLYITHTGTAAITSCSFYIAPYTAGTYLGTRTAQDDYDELIDWGDAAYPLVTGGVWINQDADGGFPDGSWEVFRTGYGDSLANAITLSSLAIITGAAVAGQIETGGEAHIRVKTVVPAAESDTGLRYFDLEFDYVATV